MELLSLSKIRTDGGTQSRAKLDEEWVRELAGHLDDGADLPPVVVFYDGHDHWLADGFHRVRGYVIAGRTEIPVDVRQGAKRDAVLFSVGANATHGLRRSNADKRRAVEVLLRDEEWQKWTDRKIAEACGVSHPFVATVRSAVVTVTTSTPSADPSPARGAERKRDERADDRPPAPAKTAELEDEPDEDPNDADDPGDYAPESGPRASAQPPAIPGDEPPPAIPRASSAESMLDVTRRCVLGLTAAERAELFRDIGVVPFATLFALREERERDPQYAVLRKISEPNANATRTLKMIAAVLDGGDAGLALLGCTWSSSPDEIRRAYREASLHAHPDREGGNASLMTALNQAYAIVRAFVEAA